MKTLFFLALLPVFAFAQPLPQTVKVADGTVAVCNDSVDAFLHKRGAYKLDVSAPKIKGDWLIFEVKTQFLACVEQEGKWGFKPVSLFAPLSYRMPGDEITVSTLDAYLTLSRDNEFITTQAWDADSTMIAVGIDSVVTEEEKSLLESGADIDVSVDFQMEKDLSFTSKTGLSSDERAVFGSYRRHFTIKR